MIFFAHLGGQFKRTFKSTTFFFKNCNNDVKVLIGENTQILNDNWRFDLTAIYCLGDLEKCKQNAGECADHVVQATATTENGITTIKDENGNVLASYKSSTPQPRGELQPDGSLKFVDENGNVRYEGKRIYTIEEALEVSGPKNRFRIRYK